MSVTVHLSEDEVQALQRMADREGRTPEQVARRAVLEYTSGWRRERDRLIEAILQEDVTVLRRLGNT
ncbi:MAG: hypothetical protein JWM02_2636 [Frankiales bacterium]|nr:hypothetical protein [Frankiales bacterium]